MATELAKGVYWVGVVDWAVRHFHGHELSTHRGTTYNSYLVMDDKVALVDAVWDPFAEEFLKNIAEVVDPAKIDYLVANHAEPDHSGALPRVMELCPNATVVVSKRGAESIPGHYHRKWNFRPVGTGERLSLGRREMVFVEAPMLHWPDTMFTYLTGVGAPKADESALGNPAILMSNDAFGQHYATAFRFNDQVNQDELYFEALKYYANILTPFSSRVGPKIDELLALNVPIAMIAPSHGVIWRKDPMQIVNTYRQWAAQVPARRAVIVYDTMWQATRRMAEAIGEGLRDSGVDFKLLHMAVTDRNDALTDIFGAKAVLVGSPSLNNGLLPSIMPILEDLKGLKFKNKVGAAFGSYGWSGECVKLIEEHLQKSGIVLAAPGVRAKWQPGDPDFQACRQLGRQVAQAVLKD